MNGAAAVPPSSINMPSTRNTARIGISQNFRLSSRYSQNSPTSVWDFRSGSKLSEIFATTSSSSELLEVLRRRRAFAPSLPIRRGRRIEPPAQLVATDHAKDHGDRGEQAEVRDREQGVADDPGDGKGGHQPAHVQRTQCLRSRDADGRGSRAGDREDQRRAPDVVPTERSGAGEGAGCPSRLRRPDNEKTAEQQPEVAQFLPLRFPIDVNHGGP